MSEMRDGAATPSSGADRDSVKAIVADVADGAGQRGPAAAVRAPATGMATPRLDAVVERIRKVYVDWGRDTPVATRRDDWDRLFPPAPVGTVVEAADADGVACVWIAAPGARTDRTVLYLHGGGFQVGSTRSHAELMAGISRASGCRVLGVDYRLAPEHALPDAMADAATAYRWLLALHDSASEIVLAGDSAGANLCLTLALALRDTQAAALPDSLPDSLPAALVLLSPWTDMTASGDSYATRAAADPIHQRRMIQALARQALGPSLQPADPRASPLFADPAGLPPTLVQVGDRETLLSDSTAWAGLARAAGVDVTLQVHDGMIHVFQQFPGDLPDARAAVTAIGAFIDSIVLARAAP